MQNILIVDDEPMILKLFSKFADKLGYKPVIAETGSEALEIFESHKEDFSLIILDLTLPDFTGDQLLPIFRERDPQIPILIATGYAEKDITQLFAKEDDLTAFIQKPFTMNSIEPVVKRLIKPKK